MKKSSAFTLIEMIVTTAIVSFLTLVLSAVMSQGLRSYRVGQARIDNNEKASDAVSVFEKVTRGATEVVEAKSDSLIFFAYLRGDNQPAPSKINFYLDGEIFYKSVIVPSGPGPVFSYLDSDAEIKPVATNVKNTAPFSYFDERNQEISLPAQTDFVKMINISVHIDNDPSRPPEEAVQATSVSLRNLKNNL